MDILNKCYSHMVYNFLEEKLMLANTDRLFIFKMMFRFSCRNIGKVLGPPIQGIQKRSKIPCKNPKSRDIHFMDELNIWKKKFKYNLMLRIDECRVEQNYLKIFSCWLNCVHNELLPVRSMSVVRMSFGSLLSVNCELSDTKPPSTTMPALQKI